MLMAKKHHYVPVTYLKNFTDEPGQLTVFRKDDPTRPFLSKPEAAGFEKHYYSQWSPEGERDTDKLETLFSTAEGHWPAIVGALRDRKASFPDMHQLIVFISLTAVRGPAFRDAAELLEAYNTLEDLKILNEMGELPPPPEHIPNLFEKLRVAIDPQVSLLAMAKEMKNVAALLQGMYFDVLHDRTGRGFLTSDNPVIYFDPRIAGARQRPYGIAGPHGPAEFYMPVTHGMALRGRRRPIRSDVGHRDVDDLRKIREINRLVARYAYHSVFARDTSWQNLITQYAGNSPVLDFEARIVGSRRQRHWAMTFGPRPVKPKWTRDENDGAA